MRMTAGVGLYVDVGDRCEALTDTLDQLGDVVSIDGRLLGDAAIAGETYVCVTTAGRRQAMHALLKLLELSLDDDDLHHALGTAGAPRVARVGHQFLIWWPHLYGRPPTMH